MLSGPKRRRLLSGGGAILATLALALGPGAGAAAASGPPILGEAWASSVFSTTAHLSAQIDPDGLTTTYHVDYIARAAYEANLAASREPFNGAQRVPASSEVSVGSGSSFVTVTQLPFSLTPATAYRYRFLAHNSAGTVETTPPLTFATQAAAAGPLLPDDRGWEMVSPVEKNGGQVDPPGAIAGGGVLQAAADGNSVTYGSAASFAGGQGAPPASQYLATRTGAGWSTENITAPIFSGTYDTANEGVPYQLFSPDLSSALLWAGDHCRGGATGCAVDNPPLSGTEAPAGYQDYYLRDNGAGSFQSLLTSADAANLDLAPADFDLRLAGASPDLQHVVLSTCAALTPDATEVPQGSGCDPTAQNLYEWSAGGGLSLINTAPGAALAAPAGAVSDDGERVYFTQGGTLYLREGAIAKPLEAAAEFQVASTDGSIAFFTAAGHLYRYQAAGAGTSAELTPSGGVVGVLGASDSGSVVYYQDGSGLERWQGGVTTQVAAGADASDPEDSPPATGTARVSADGEQLLFVSTASLSGYDSTDLIADSPDSEVYLYDASGAGTLACISCNPTGERPIGPSTIPGALANGTAPGATDAYEPRVLSADGRRVFFDSADALVLTDTNTSSADGAGVDDVYQWEAQGEGSCARAGGCLALISSGRSAGGASFVDASADGSDAFFLTDDSLVPSDPGALDLYDARIGGGFPEPPPPLPCEGDSCQSLPSEPTDPTLDTLLLGKGNPPVHYVKHCASGLRKRHDRCVKKRPDRRHHHRGGRR